MNFGKSILSQPYRYYILYIRFSLSNLLWLLSLFSFHGTFNAHHLELSSGLLYNSKLCKTIRYDTHRTFANETSQFLAPYDQSVKSRSGNSSAGSGGDTNLTSNSYGGSNPGLFAAPITQSSVSNAELTTTQPTLINRSGIGETIAARIDTWNPFEEQPFDQMTEDHIFEAEFDKIRQRGSQGSRF